MKLPTKDQITKFGRDVGWQAAVGVSAGAITGILSIVASLPLWAVSGLIVATAIMVTGIISLIRRAVVVRFPPAPPSPSDQIKTILKSHKDRIRHKDFQSEAGLGLILVQLDCILPRLKPSIRQEFSRMYAAELKTQNFGILGMRLETWLEGLIASLQDSDLRFDDNGDEFKF